MLRGQHNKPNVIKKEIIRYILTQPHETEEPALRDYLKEKYNIHEKKSISNHLEKLRQMGCIRKYEKPGLANCWRIENSEQIDKISKTYEELIPDLQKNDTILSMVANKHKKLVKPVPTLDWDKATPTVWGTLEHGEPFLRRTVLSGGVPLNEELEFGKLSDFKYRLKTSPTFFKKCLSNETHTLQEAFNEVYPMTFQGQRVEVIKEIYRTKGKTFDLGPGGSSWDSHKTIYAACVIADLMSGYRCEEAIELVKNESRVEVEFYCSEEMELLKKIA